MMLHEAQLPPELRKVLRQVSRALGVKLRVHEVHGVLCRVPSFWWDVPPPSCRGPCKGWCVS